MMSTRPTPLAQPQSPPAAVLNTASVSEDTSPVSGSPGAPVRDSSSLRAIKSGPGHEKFPSWPVAAAQDAPQVLRAPPSGGSHRSKSWTDHTTYPKEKAMTYTRPYTKRQHVYSKQLKTVMERCEKIPPETFESRDKPHERIYFPRLDREGKALGDQEYMVPSPPERDVPKPQLTQAELSEYARTYQEGRGYSESRGYPDPRYPEGRYPDSREGRDAKGHLTQADLEEYARSYEETLQHQHQKQPSYAQSEGYHSYVSSTDSTATPFLDRLRRDSEATRPQNLWDEPDSADPSRREGRDSVVTTSSGSVSSSETLKWHGSMSDVSVASSSCTHLASSRQLIAHSARVQTPQRHHSESVLYIGGQGGGRREGWKDRETRNNHHNQLKLFPVNTYTVQPTEQQAVNHRLISLSSQASLSVADRINELERQQTKYTYLDPEKKHRVSDPTLKAIQKKALLSYYERHHSTTSKSSWRSEPQLAQSAVPQAPQPPPRPQVPQSPSRRASCASDYASSIRKNSLSRESKSDKMSVKHQHSNSCSSLSTDLLGPVIMGPAISVDDWVPERPPKNPHLRTAYPDLFQDQRVPSPDLPPPSPPPVEDEVIISDEPLPPPPTEIETANWEQEFINRLNENKRKGTNSEEVLRQTNGLPNRHIHKHSKSPDCTKSEHIRNNSDNDKFSDATKNEQIRSMLESKRHSQKVFLNGNVAVSQKVSHNIQDPYHSEVLRPLKPPVQPPSDDKRKPPAQLPMEVPVRGSGELRNMQRSSLVEADGNMPPPLHPRQMRINQSMRARIPDARRNSTSRSSPPKYEEKREGIEARRMSCNMSQSKASYLASRRDRDHGLPNADIGSYKRTMSPSGQSLQVDGETPRMRENGWTINRQAMLTKECNAAAIMRNNNNNNSNLLRRSSLVETKSGTKADSMLAAVLKCDSDKKSPCNLPDVLPLNAKVSPARSQFMRSLSEDKERLQHQPSPLPSPANSPTTKSPTIAQKMPPSFSSHSLMTQSPPKIMQPSAQISPKLSMMSQSPPRLTPNHISPKLSPAHSPKSVYSTDRCSPPKLSESPAKCSVLSVPKCQVATLTDCSLEKVVESPKVIEGLQLIQRTEVTLRVNTCTIDAASQTEKEEILSTPLPARKKLQEEIDCEQLSQDLADQLSPSDKLKNILAPGPEHKKPTDYVSGLFKVEVTSRPRPQNSPFRSRNNTPNSSPPPSISLSSTTSQTENLSKSTEMTIPVLEPTSPLSATSTYFTTSESKAKFLTRYCHDMSQYNVLKDTKDLNQKKEELVNRLDRKLEVLRSEQLVVSEECKLNDDLGLNVERHVNRVARPDEASKFRVHVEEVGKITSLLLSLSGRLARAENALMGLPTHHTEKKILEGKRDKLQEQLQEAKKLKESIDRRSVSISNILYKYLNSEEYADYDHFINMKAKLIMDSRDIADKIKLGEEQLLALKETLLGSVVHPTNV